METSVSLLERLAAQPSDLDWQRLIELYQPLLRVWLVKAGVAGCDGDDLCQEILIVVFREVSKFERRGQGAFRSWLRTILANRVRNYFRLRQNRAAAEGGSEILQVLAALESPESPLSQLWDREHDDHVIGTLLRRVQADFMPATWQAFRRYVLEGEPAAGVAAELSMSLNSVLLAKSRVLKKLRQELDGLVDY